MAWSDGSHVEYTNWFPHEPNDSGHQEDEVELRMACDGYACFGGTSLPTYMYVYMSCTARSVWRYCTVKTPIAPID